MSFKTVIYKAMVHRILNIVLNVLLVFMKVTSVMSRGRFERYDVKVRMMTSQMEQFYKHYLMFLNC